MEVDGLVRYGSSWDRRGSRWKKLGEPLNYLNSITKTKTLMFCLLLMSSCVFIVSSFVGGVFVYFFLTWDLCTEWEVRAGYGKLTDLSLEGTLIIYVSPLSV